MKLFSYFIQLAQDRLFSALQRSSKTNKGPEFLDNLIDFQIPKKVCV